MLAVLLSAFKTDNLEKFDKEEKDERIAIVIFYTNIKYEVFSITNFFLRKSQDSKDGFINFVAVALVLVVNDFLSFEMITQLVHQKEQICQVYLYFFNLECIPS